MWVKTERKGEQLEETHEG